MAEFCLKCFQKYIDPTAKETNLIISAEPELCEGCKDYQHVVVCYKRKKIIVSLLKNIFNKITK